MLIKAMIKPFVKEYWLKYGTIHNVVDRLLKEVPYEGLPCLKVNDNRPDTKVLVNVVDADYLDIRDVYKRSDPTISLARILTYYCMIDYAESMGWEPGFISIKNIDVISLIDSISSSVDKLDKYIQSTNGKKIIKHIQMELKVLSKEEL